MTSRTFKKCGWLFSETNGEIGSVQIGKTIFNLGDKVLKKDSDWTNSSNLGTITKIYEPLANGILFHFVVIRWPNNGSRNHESKHRVTDIAHVSSYRFSL